MESARGLTLFILDSSISSKLFFLEAVQQGSSLQLTQCYYRRKPKLN
jgi:hypothetical protein